MTTGSGRLCETEGSELFAHWCARSTLLYSPRKTGSRGKACYVLFTAIHRGSVLSPGLLWPLRPSARSGGSAGTVGGAEDPHLSPSSSSSAHLPHSHLPDLRRDRAPDEQGAAPIPGVGQADLSPHPAPSIPFQLMVSKQGLELLGAGVVPGPRGLLLENKTGAGGGLGLTGQRDPCRPLRRPGQTQDVGAGSPFAATWPRWEPHSSPPPAWGGAHLAIADSARPHARAEGRDKGQGADAVRGQIARQQTPEPAGKRAAAAAEVRGGGAPRPWLTPRLGVHAHPFQSDRSPWATDVRQGLVSGTLPPGAANVGEPRVLPYPAARQQGVA